MARARGPTSQSRSYTEEDLKAAADCVLNKKLSLRKASQEYGIPLTTLARAVKSGDATFKKFGPPTVLTETEEECLVKWLKLCQKIGRCRQEENRIDAVKKILNEDKRENPFVDNKSGRAWLTLCFKRHPDISLRTPESVTKNRTAVSE